MRTPRIYTEQALRDNSSVELEASPSVHIARALRMQVGGALVLFNGQGGEYPAKITALDKKKVIATTAVCEPGVLESPLPIHLGIAISRGDRMDWVVQKATELGAVTVTPLLTERTEVKLKGERAQKKVSHWQQISISACEQSGRNLVPQINELMGLQQWLSCTEAECRLVLHHRADTVPEQQNAPASVALLIGPEGGLSETEIAAAEQAGYQSLRLGPRVMRTETAPLAALAILQARWGDMAP